MKHCSEGQREGQQMSRGERARLHRQRAAALERRQRQREQVLDLRRHQEQARVAAQRHIILGVQRVAGALHEIERAQQPLREAGSALGAALSIAPLARAYEQFKTEGGVTAADWHDWLDGKSLARDLRVVFARVPWSSLGAEDDDNDLEEDGDADDSDG